MLENLVDSSKVDAWVGGYSFCEPGDCTDKLIVHFDNDRLHKKFHFVNKNEIRVSLLHANVAIEEGEWQVFPLVLGAPGSPLIESILRIHDMWEELARFSAEVVIELDIGHSQLHILVLISIN